MATHDYVIDNSTGANVRADINNVLQAILTNNSSSSAPSTTAAYMWWADTTNGVLKIRNSANNAWVELLQLDGTITIEDGSASTPGLAFRTDLNTGFFKSAGDTLNVSTGGTTRGLFNSDGFTATGGVSITSTGNASLVFDCGTGGTGGNQISFIDFKINGTVKSNIAVNEATSGNPLELGSAGNGAVHAFFDNSLKFQTTSDGVTIEGSQHRFKGDIRFDNNTNADKDIFFDESGNRLNFFDDVKATFGNSDDLQIYHSGGNSFLQNSTGSFVINADAYRINNGANNENIIKADADGSVELYEDNVKQFETTSVGTQLKGQTRYATSGGTFCALTEVFRNTSHTAGASLSFQTVNGHGGGTVTVTLTVNGNAAVKTTKMFGMALRSTSNSGLSSEVFSINSGSGVSFSVSGSSQGVTVANTSSSDCTCTVRFDMSGSL